MNGGAGGTGFQGPSAANLTNPVAPGQIASAGTAVQGGLTAQQQLLAALQQQQGISNQNQVYGQLQGIASGAVNPAQTQFNQNTAANVANTTAAMAGQRGAAQNVGLIARQAGQAGAGIQQTAAGQEATQQANSQIAAIGQAGQVANTQAANQIGQTNANTQALTAEQQALLNAQAYLNSSTAASQSSVNAGNTNLATTTMGNQSGLIGGGLQGLAAGAAAAAGANGGVVRKMADGGSAFPATSGAQSKFGQFLIGIGNSAQDNIDDTPTGPQTGAQQLQKGTAAATSQGVQALVKALSSGSGGSSAGADAAMAKGGRVKALLSPGEKVIPPSKVKAVANGGKLSQNSKDVPGKPRVGGAVNSYANDVVEAEPEVGSIVIPRSITMSKNVERKAADFVRAAMAKRRAK